MTIALGRRPIRLAISAGGGVCFAASLIYFGERYARGFDALRAPDGSPWNAAVFDLLLFAGFGLHHSVFARAGIKAAFARVLPASLERSGYVWIASLLFIAVLALWRPVPGTWWSLDGTGAWALRVVQLAAAAFTLAAARGLDVLELAGVRQALEQPTGRRAELDTSGPYAVVRHPIYMAWVVLVWAAPVMTGTRVVFAGLSTLYLVAAIPLEERDLRRAFGAEYAQYAARVRWRLIPGVY